jgi:thiamine-phosphate pyrophosphorylase
VPPSLRRHYPDQVQTVGGPVPPSQPSRRAPVVPMVLPGRVADTAPVTPSAPGIHAKLSQARLYFVCEGRWPGGDTETLLDAALAGGADIVQLRQKEAGEDGDLVADASAFRVATARHGALFILNDRPDLVEACGADGVHVGQDDLPVADARSLLGANRLIGLSTHSPAQLDAACAARGDAAPDYVSVGPVWETPTKPGRPATGLDYVRYAAEHASLPWFAIGGIDAENVADVAAAGARRVVVVRAIRDAADPQGAARTLRAALRVPVEAR